MAVYIIDVLKFPKYEIQFLLVQGLFTPPGFVTIFSSVSNQSIDLEFSNSSYHKLFKIKQFPISIPRNIGGIGDKNGYTNISIPTTSQGRIQPLFDSYQTYEFNLDANQKQFYVNCADLSLRFLSNDVDLAYWNNKYDSAHYALIDFPKSLTISEVFAFNGLSLGSNVFEYSFKLGLYFAYENDPDLLLYI